MPKVYQAYFKNNDVDHRTHSGSRVDILAEAKAAATEHGKEVKVDILEMEKLSFKYLIELLNGKRPTSRTRLCSFVPHGRPFLKNADGETVKRWKVKKKKAGNA